MHRHTHLYILLNLSFASSFTLHTLPFLLLIVFVTLSIMATFIKLFVTLSIISLLVCSTNAQLTNNFYARTCPSLQTIVRNTMISAIKTEARIGASILRLFFHDCFVNV